MRTMRLLVILTVVLRAAAAADIPQIISYQGKVTDAAGNPVPDASYTMRFRMNDAPTGGGVLWDSGELSVPLTGGVFSVLLGESPQPALSLDFSADYWLQVTFAGVDQSPRQRMASTGYAYMASGLAVGTEVSGAITSAPNAALKASNTATTGAHHGLYGWSSSTAGAGVYGYANSTTGTSSGVTGYARSNTGRAVSGYAAATSGGSYGGHFATASRDGAGVYGEGGWIGVHGVATQTSDIVTGVYGETGSPSGIGVRGHATATTENAEGGRFLTRAPAGRGVYGLAYATTGESCGGYFETFSPSGVGIRGTVNAYSGTSSGVLGLSNSPSGRGVHGTAPLYGIYGEATGNSGVTAGGYFETVSPEGTGVRGTATATTGVTYGMFGRVYSTTDGARAINGRAYGTTGLTYGVYGRSDSGNGIGVYGIAATAGLSYGVYGAAQASNGIGVYGEGNIGGRFVSIASSSSGVSAAGGYSGGYFEDSNSNSSWAHVGSGTYKIYGNGTVNFVQNHPIHHDRVIVYTCPEGDEAATYTRGTARLSGGEARVSLGETFQWVTNPEVGLTAHVTPRGACEGLFVEMLSTTEMVVRELHDGRSDVVFDYIVYGLRSGFEEVSVVQEKIQEAPVPSMEEHHSRYAAYPQLRQYNALARFQAMRAATDARP